MEIDGLHVTLHPEVYRPGDDTLLLAKCVLAELRKGDRFLEVGCGSGFTLMVAARAGAVASGTDLNPHAVALTRHNLRENHLKATVAEGDLLAGLAGPFDVVAFNPPYLPTTPEEKLPGPLNLAFDGGLSGTETAERFVAAVLPLRPRVVLVVHSSLADPGPLVTGFRAAGYAHDVAAQEAHAFEEIRVERFRLA